MCGYTLTLCRYTHREEPEMMIVRAEGEALAHEIAQLQIDAINGLDPEYMGLVSPLFYRDLVEDQLFSTDGGKTWYLCYLPLFGNVSVKMQGTRSVLRTDVPEKGIVLALPMMIHEG